METLKTLHAKIEKKTNNIARAKKDLTTANNDCIISTLKDFIKKNKIDKELFQKQFDEMYEKFN